MRCSAGGSRPEAGWTELTVHRCRVRALAGRAASRRVAWRGNLGRIDRTRILKPSEPAASRSDSRRTRPGASSSPLARRRVMLPRDSGSDLSTCRPPAPRPAARPGTPPARRYGSAERLRRKSWRAPRSNRPIKSTLTTAGRFAIHLPDRATTDPVPSRPFPDDSRSEFPSGSSDVCLLRWDVPVLLDLAI
jgi:hypothetical protein